MHDPLTVAFEIRWPWPRIDSFRTRRSAEQGIRWRLGRPYPVLGGRGLTWPSLITVWHRDPSGYDDITCHALRGSVWRFHVHHWRLQVHPYQQVRRRLLTRCQVCGGRSVKGRTVSVSTQWDSPRGPWWRGEQGLTHADCYARRPVHQPVPVAEPDFDVEVD